MKTIAVVFGTRPDTIKLAPVIKALQKESQYFRVITIASAQHRQMLDQVLDVFEIKPDFDLNIMMPRQTLAGITERILSSLDEVFDQVKPDMVIVQGDTSTTFVGSLAAFYRQIPVAHVEAGLRTNDKANPFPEEINRRLTSVMTDLHFAPTQTSKNALIKENIDVNSVYITGNTVIDALDISVKKIFKFETEILNDIIEQSKKFVVITMHRRENWGLPMTGACEAVKELAEKNPEINFVFPVHLNPVVRDVVIPILKNIENVYLIEPLDYSEFVNLMVKSYLILTDSGGIQEEGPHFGIPILVLRLVTERPEAVEYGTAKLLGLDKDVIINEVQKLITDNSEYSKMANSVNPYGDGLASERIVKIIKKYFGFTTEDVEEFIV